MAPAASVQTAAAVVAVVAVIVIAAVASVAVAATAVAVVVAWSLGFVVALFDFPRDFLNLCI